jgi:hypothetical protein
MAAQQASSATSAADRSEPGGHAAADRLGNLRIALVVVPNGSLLMLIYRQRKIGSKPL